MSSVYTTNSMCMLCLCTRHLESLKNHALIIISTFMSVCLCTLYTYFHYQQDSHPPHLSHIGFLSPTSMQYTHTHSSFCVHLECIFPHYTLYLIQTLLTHTYIPQSHTLSIHIIYTHTSHTLITSAHITHTHFTPSLLSTTLCIFTPHCIIHIQLLHMPHPFSNRTSYSCFSYLFLFLYQSQGNPGNNFTIAIMGSIIPTVGTDTP